MRWALGAAIIGPLVAAGLVASFLLTGRAAPERPLPPGATIAALLPRADTGNGARLFRQCANCHSIGRESPDRDGPNLYGVLDAPVAGHRPHYGYTQALRSVGGRWSAERLDAWLRSPQAFAPGTRMAFPGLPGAWDRADLVAYLGTQGP